MPPNFCPQCGSQITDSNTRFCPNCGHSFIPQQPQTPPVQTPPRPQQVAKDTSPVKIVLLVLIPVFIAIIGILALIAIPNFVSLRAKAYNASASSAGYNAKIAQELYFQNSMTGRQDGTYADNLAALLKWDKLLTDDPNVTFTFGDCNSEGYTYTTTHANGDNSMEFTD